MKAGIAMLASNRKENSVIPDMSILENMYLSEQVLSARQPLISAGRERERYEKYKKLLSHKSRRSQGSDHVIKSVETSKKFFLPAG